MSSIVQNVKSVQTSELVNFIKSANLLAQADILAISKLFRSVCTLFSFSQVNSNLQAGDYPLYSAAIPANLFIDDGDAIELDFFLNVINNDDAVIFKVNLGGQQIYETNTNDSQGGIHLKTLIWKAGDGILRSNTVMICDGDTPQIPVVRSASFSGYDFSVPLAFSITGSSTVPAQESAYGYGGKITYNPA